MAKNFENFASSRWILTLHSYTEETVAAIKAIPCKACVAGYEICPKTGNKHVQMAISFGKRMIRAKALMDTLKTHCVPQKMKGDWCDQSYCIKDGDIIRMTDDRKQGERTDIVTFRDSIKRGASTAELLDQHPRECAKYPRFIGLCREAYAENEVLPLPKGSKRSNYYVWGEADAGKSTFVEESWGKSPQVYEKLDNKWWNEYAGQETVVIDDPRPSQAKHLFGYLKRWCNERPVRVEAKHGCKMIRPKRFIITANVAPDVLFGEYYEEAPFMARFHVIQFTRAMRGTLMPGAPDKVTQESSACA